MEYFGSLVLFTDEALYEQCPYHIGVYHCNGNAGGAGSPNACDDLTEAEEFEYGAIAAAVASCNGHDARLNLKVARAFLDEVQRDLAGTSKDGWNLPDITNEVSGANECSE